MPMQRIRVLNEHAESEIWVERLRDAGYDVDARKVRAPDDLKALGRPVPAAVAIDLARYANNRQVWLQLRDRFPSPYVVENAREYIGHIRSRTPATAFAVTVGDAPVGAIGVMLRDDVERCSAEVGYWFGEPY